jgi:hypothetical protein
VYNRGQLTVFHRNLDGNTTGRFGGGLLNSGGSVTLIDSVVTNNTASEDGGGLFNSGNGVLTVIDSLLRGNTSQTSGGGIFNQGELAVSGSTLTNNSVVGSLSGLGGGICNTSSGTAEVAGSALSGNSAHQGGGIEMDSGTLTLTDSALDSNSASSGGGIRNLAGTLTVSNCTLSRNSASHGGGISNEFTLSVTDSAFRSNSADVGGGLLLDSGTATVTGSTFSSNTATYGGMAFVDATVTVTTSTISSNTATYAGGILNAGVLTLTACTVSANSARFDGGGIGNSGGMLTVTDSTLSGNSTTESGGGIANVGTLTVTNSTLSGNSAVDGGGVWNSVAGTLALENSIVAGNTGTPGSGPDVNGSVQDSSGYNLVGIGDGSLSGISNAVNHNQIGTADSPIDPRLLPLGDYGGPTYTQAMLPGSPALDAGDPSQAGSPDQRGVTRSSPVNIGAFQASAVILFVYAPATVTAGDRFDVRVAAFDPYGLTDFGYTGTVTLSISDPQVGIIGTHTYTLADAGSFTFSAISTTAGPQTLTADDGTLTGTADLTVLPGAAAYLVFVPPGRVQVGVPFSLGVAAYDSFGNLATGYTGTVEITRSDGGDPIVYTFTAADSGQQAFSVTVSQSGLVSFFLRDQNDPNVNGDQLDLMF